VTMCLFIGPTLRREEVAAACNAVCLPPVAQGDVYRAAQRGPRAIGIVDGYFCGAPAVWHKEILWALSQGIHVFGSASMGALRAAELHDFGMRGVGRIFEAFRDGILEDDDEVAVVHGPAEIGYLAASEAMVNIRATLARAEADGILTASSRRALESFGKSLYFPQRCWSTLLEGKAIDGVAEAELSALQDWLPHGRVDQKREDALEMLQAMQESLARPDPPPTSFHFEWTHFWNELVARPAINPSSWDDVAKPPDQPVLEELRLEGVEVYGRVKAKALLRLLAGIEAKRLGLPMSQGAMRATLSRIRAALGLYAQADLEAWLSRNDLDAPSLERLVEDETRLVAVLELAGRSIERGLLDELRLSGAYERLAERARKKRTLLAARGLDAGERSAPGPKAVDTRLWYFEKRLGQPVPDDVAAFARELGFATLADFDSALLREQLYFYMQPRNPRI